MAGAPARSHCAEGWRDGDRRRIARVSCEIISQMAVAGCVCLRRQHPPDFGRQVQEKRAARTLCRLGLGEIGPIVTISRWARQNRHHLKPMLAGDAPAKVCLLAQLRNDRMQSAGPAFARRMAVVTIALVVGAFSTSAMAQTSPLAGTF